MNESKSKKQWTTEEVQKVLDLIKTLDCVSLNKLIAVGDDLKNYTELGDLIQDTSPGPQEYIEQKDTAVRLLRYIDKLTPRQQRVIKLRFGLEDGVSRTLDEVGLIYGVTRERIRQVEMKALDKLRYLIITKDKCNIENF